MISKKVKENGLLQEIAQVIKQQEMNSDLAQVRKRTEDANKATSK